MHSASLTLLRALLMVSLYRHQSFNPTGIIRIIIPRIHRPANFRIDTTSNSPGRLFVSPRSRLWITLLAASVAGSSLFARVVVAFRRRGILIVPGWIQSVVASVRGACDRLLLRNPTSVYFLYCLSAISHSDSSGTLTKLVDASTIILIIFNLLLWK